MLHFDRPWVVAVSRLLGSAITLITAPILARGLGASGRGDAAALLAVLAVLPVVLSFGVPIEIRRRAAVGDQPSGAVKNAYVLAVLSFVPSIFAALILAQTLFEQVLHFEKVMIVLSISAAPILLVQLILANWFLGSARYIAFAVVATGPVIMNLPVVVILFLTNQLTVGSIGVVHVGGIAVGCAIGLAIARLSPEEKRPSFFVTLAKSSRFSVSQIADVSSQRLLQIVALPIIGAHEAGLYAIAVTIGLVPMAFGQALSGAALTSLGASSADQASLERRLATASLSSSMCLCLILMIATPFVIPWIFGSEFIDAIVPTLIFLAGGMFATAVAAQVSAIIVRNQGAIYSLVQLSGVFVSVMFLIFFKDGSAGAAAFASTLGYFVVWLGVQLALRTKPSSLLPRPRGIIDAFNWILRK